MAVCTSATSAAEEVSEVISHDAATMCIQVPRLDATDAIQTARKMPTRSGLQGDSSGIAVCSHRGAQGGLLSPANLRSLEAVAQESLRITLGPAAGSEISLDDELLIGRAAPGLGQLAGDPELSREHARISRNAHGQIVVEDLGSTNGTYVNGWLLSEMVALSPGDVVRAGTSELQLIQAGVELYQPTLEVSRPPQIQADAAVAPAGATNTIEVEYLVREYKNGPRAVDGISLYVGPGQVYGFLGPNGAGKSTAVHVLTTLLAPSGGTARVAGYDVASQGAQVRANIGVALQEAALDPVLTAWEHMGSRQRSRACPRPSGARAPSTCSTAWR